MPPLSPTQAAVLALNVYLVKASDPNAFQGLPDGYSPEPVLKGRTGLGPGVLSNLGYLAVRPESKEAIIAIRGTIPTFPPDVATDALLMDLSPVTDGGVHAGFLRAWSSVVERVDEALPAHALGGVTVHCIGHSLGGALATLAADHLSRRGARVFLYTFGAPRVGGAGFCQQLTARVGPDRIFRVYHPADPVTMVPLFPFTHVPWNRSGCAIRCGPNERISVSRHSMEGYVQFMSGVSFAQLRQNGPQRLTDRQIEHWLATVKAGGWVQNWGARAAELIGIALDWVLRKLLEGGLALLQPFFAAGVSALDVLAWALHRATQVAERTAWYVEAIIQAILQFIGRAWDRTKSLTYEFLRWALETAAREIRRLVASALHALPRI
ncbi:MAG: lipase family protein [Burkholderiales bacterium]|nr:lipase family protein [Burkholderiales bacterium]